ncbi:hypothetical protein Q5Y75_11285 [Ruegeria sp. 2205SS24-7]|uniref:hypothetical protein n=1 Tax=Ruegeria discodermiae TaxID=3064389 RepID=UPI00274044CF|nr:hypothetical protein [Ruegeria sp. 2205SS24-7]MDP5217804.1 hypothetical protein [Ruegeria sp. 2205SS24-7]
MKLTEKPEVRDLLTAARATRTYCMLTGRGGDKSDKLIDALAPFDGSPSQIKPQHLVELRKAMRDTCRDIDDYTLTRILDGDSPVRISNPSARYRKPSAEEEQDLTWATWLPRALNRTRQSWPWFWQRWVLPGIAIMLLLLAMHYTHWSFSANLLLSRLDDHIATDIHEEVRDLIVVARAIETNGRDGANPASSAPAQKLFNETMSRLKAYHYQEEALRAESASASQRFDVLIATRESANGISAKLFPPQRRPLPPPSTLNAQAATQQGALGIIGPSLGREQTLSAASDVMSTVTQIERETTRQMARAANAATATPAGEAGAQPASANETAQQSSLVQIALAGHDGFLEIVREISKKTGRNSRSNPADHIVTRLQLLQSAEELKAKISLANRFALPMVYGSLGAALFCLVRVLTPALSDLGPARAFLRILFGAFAAMTLSMLFIPANVFSINEQSNPTLIFLACFLFGYSFDAVLAALHRMEAFLQGRLQPQETPRAP